MKTRLLLKISSFSTTFYRILRIIWIILIILIQIFLKIQIDKDENHKTGPAAAYHPTMCIWLAFLIAQALVRPASGQLQPISATAGGLRSVSVELYTPCELYEMDVEGLKEVIGELGQDLSNKSFSAPLGSTGREHSLRFAGMTRRCAASTRLSTELPFACARRFSGRASKWTPTRRLTGIQTLPQGGHCW